MFRSYSAAIPALLALTLTSLARAQTPGDSTLTPPVTAPAVAGDTSGLAHQIALGDSARALLAEDESQTQVDQARLDSLQSLVARDRSSIPRPTASKSREVAAVAQTKRAIRQDLAREKQAQARLASIDRKIKKQQMPQRPDKKKPAPSHSGAGSH